MTAPAPGPNAVAVVGAGISGLVAARRLAQSGRRVILVERSDRIGGQIRTLDLAGHRVDVGAEALHLASPVARRIVDELGLTDSVVSSRPGPSWLWTSRGRRRLPAGVGPSGPTRLRPVLRSGVMSATGLVRAGLEPVFTRLRGPLDLDGRDTSVGHFVTSRFGREVTDRFVDPLLGGLHAGDVNNLSLRACAPALVAAAEDGRSLVLRRGDGASRLRPFPSSGTPTPGASTSTAGRALPGGALFASWAQGLGTLVEALLADVEVDVRLGLGASGLQRRGPGYRLTLDDGDTLDVDGVVLAVPSHPAGRLLEPLLGADASAPLRAQRFASVATVVLGVPRERVADTEALAGNGILVPSGTGTLLKAVTHLSTKWPHLDCPETYLLRLSAGRDGSDLLADLDDAALVARLRVELERFTGITAEPSVVHVERWEGGLPQLHVGHLDRLATVREALDESAPGVVLAGASYDGVGLAACIASAELAAETLLARRAGTAA